MDTSQVNHTSTTTKPSDVVPHVSQTFVEYSHASQVNSTSSAMNSWFPNTESKSSSNEVQAASQMVDTSEVEHTSSSTESSDVVPHVSQPFVIYSHASQVDQASSAMRPSSPDTDSKSSSHNVQASS